MLLICLLILSTSYSFGEGNRNRHWYDGIGTPVVENNNLNRLNIYNTIQNNHNPEIINKTYDAMIEANREAREINRLYYNRNDFLKGDKK